jgi:ABC-type branched-subunit amino acid transport system substrate-binding protein
MKIPTAAKGTALVALAGLALAACSSGGEAAGSNAPLNEAIVIAYTGTSSFEGVGTDAAVLPAIYEINKSGGIMGHQLTDIPVDTRSDPADALPAVEKLLATSSNLIGAVGVDTTSAPTIVPVLNTAHIPMMVNAGEATYNKNTYPYFWRLVAPDSAAGVAEAIWAKRQGYTRVAAVFGNDPGSQGDLPGVIAAAKALHLDLVDNMTLTEDLPTYNAEVQRLINSHPQAIFTEEDGATAATFFGELKQQGHLLPIIASNSALQSSWYSPMRGAVGQANVSKYVTAIALGSPKASPGLASYMNGVQHAKGVQKPFSQWYTNPIGFALFDGVIVQALAMDAAHSLKPDVYNKYILDVTAPGPGKVVVNTYAEGKKALSEGKHIQYVGASGPILFNKWHNSFGNFAAAVVSADGLPKYLGVISEKEIQSYGGCASC